MCPYSRGTDFSLCPFQFQALRVQPPQTKVCATHSYLSATKGSTRVARRAGREQAISAIAVNITGGNKKAIGSVGLTPNRRLFIKRVSAHEAPSPNATAKRAKLSPCLIISRQTFAC